MKESWINCLPITNPGTADSKPLGGFMLGQSKDFEWYTTFENL